LKQAKGILQNLCANEDDGCDDGCDVKDNDKRDSFIARLGFGLYQEMLDEFDIPTEDSDHDMCSLIQECLRIKLLLIQERIETARLLIQEKKRNQIKVHEHDHLELDRLCLLHERIEKRVMGGRQLKPKTIAVCRLAHNEVMHFSNNQKQLGDSVLQLIGLLNRDPDQQQVWPDKPEQSCVDVIEDKGYGILKEIPDGRCLPRALARCILGYPAYHDLMRKALLYAVLLDRVILDGIEMDEEDDVFCDVEDYAVSMFCPDTYGDGYLLLEFEKLFQIKVQVHDMQGNVNRITSESHSATLDVCHHNKHYDMLVPLALEPNCNEDDDKDEDLMDVEHNLPGDEEVRKINHTEQTSPKNEGQGP